MLVKNFGIILDSDLKCIYVGFYRMVEIMKEMVVLLFVFFCLKCWRRIMEEDFLKCWVGLELFGIECVLFILVRKGCMLLWMDSRGICLIVLLYFCVFDCKFVYCLL